MSDDVEISNKMNDINNDI